MTAVTEYNETIDKEDREQEEVYFINIHEFLANR